MEARLVHLRLDRLLNRIATAEKALFAFLCDTVGLVQNGIFVVLFAGLVVALPLLTKKRTQCDLFCHVFV